MQGARRRILMEFKLSIGCPKTKKCYKKELKEEDCKPLIGKKIGNILKGESIDFPGYEFKITGGSDSSGFPMRFDVDGSQRKKILIASGVGIKKKKRKGIRLRKTVAGNTIHVDTAQINLKIMKYGKDPLEKPSETEKKEEAKADAPKEEKKEEVKKEDKPKKEVKEEKKKEVKKEDKPKKEVKEKKKEVKKEDKPKKEVKEEKKKEEKPAEKEEKKEKKESKEDKKEEKKKENSGDKDSKDKDDQKSKKKEDKDKKSENKSKEDKEK